MLIPLTKLRTLFLILNWLWLVPGLFYSQQLRADALDQLSILSLKNYIEFQASPQDLTKLAQRQFYFKVESNHLAAAQSYSELQEAIAKKIPVEFSRPVFDVRFIFGPNEAVSNQSTVGILGGTGPLSDAHIIDLVMEQLDQESISKGIMIHLFSLPPPRTTKDQILGGINYTARLTTFMRHGYAEYFLASNTAHLNFKTLQTLSGSTHLNHLPRLIADRIRAEQQAAGRAEKLLILGTKQAWDGKLYDAIFDEKGMRYSAVNLDDELELQRWIDRIKMGLVGANESQQLKDFIAHLGQTYQAKELLLSCTELPLGLGSLMDQLVREGFKVYDSEGMIATIIAEKVMGL